MTNDDKEEVHMAVNQAIGGLILRNWMEAKRIITDYTFVNVPHHHFIQ